MNRYVGTGYLLNRAELAVRGCVETMLQPFGLTPTQFLVLFSLQKERSQSSADLARGIGVRPQSIAEIIRPLERAGLIARRAAPGHGRILRIDVSRAGEVLLARCVPLAKRLERELLRTLSPALLEALREGLDAFRRNAEAHPTSPAVRRAKAQDMMRAHMKRPWKVDDTPATSTSRKARKSRTAGR